jgi:hypothetical protein
MQPEDTNNLEMYTPETSVEETDDAGEPVVDEGAQNADFAPVHWTASEYIHEDRNWTWFVLFAIVVIGLIALSWYWQLWTFAVLVVVMAAALLVYINRQPRDIEYTLSIDQGLYVGEKLYHFNDFKSFGLIQDRGSHSIMLIPVKRFEPGVSVYFPDEVGEKIVDILGSRLPMQETKLDAFDIIVRKLHL